MKPDTLPPRVRERPLALRIMSLWLEKVGEVDAILPASKALDLNEYELGKKS